MCNIELCLLRVTTAATEKQQCFPFVLLQYVAIINVVNTEGLAMEALQHVFLIIALNMSLPKL